MPILEAPSGLTAEVRKIRGVELVNLAEQADDAAPSDAFGQVLGSCWLRTINPGPYPFVKGDSEERPPWGRILKGDVLFAFVFLRRISMPDGDTYDFDVRCEECRNRYGWSVNLAKDLTVKRLPAESAEKLRKGESFETKIGDGRVVRFNLQTTTQEDPMLRLMKQQKRGRSTFVDVLAAQTTAIEGVNPDLRARWRFLSELDLDDLYRLRDAFEDPDCGLDTAIQTRCTKRACGWVQDVNLPLGRTFFAPRRRRKEAEEEADTPTSSGDCSEGSIASGSGSSATTYSGTNTGEADTP
jgi:hypothetical protein